MISLRRWLGLIGVAAASITATLAYEIPVSDKDDTRQQCSGMYGGDIAHINVTFSPESQGQVAMVIYEWQDVKYLGKETSESDDTLPQRTYICTSDAATGGFCSQSDLGQFIIDLPGNVKLEDTSIWSRRVVFSSASSPSSSTGDVSVDFGAGADKAAEAEENGFWDNPDGNPTPTDTDFTSPWRAKRTALPEEADDDEESDEDDLVFHTMEATPTADTSSPKPTLSVQGGILRYTEPIVYSVPKTGYFCIAIIPLTVVDIGKRDLDLQIRQTADVPTHPTYKGTILFRNVFNGELSAAEYPKVNFYFGLTIAYIVFGIGWGYLCWRHASDLLPIQYYVSYLAGFLVIEMIASWGYYRFVNAHGSGVSTTAFLIVVTILDAGRNALSFFLLLVVSLGLSVVRETLGPVMTRCKILAGAHFAFGVLYATGLVYLELESTSALILLLFVIPLAFTLSGFLMWIMHALNGTIKELRERKQRYKLRMFKRLQMILFAAIVIIGLFFVLSSMTFSERLEEDFAPNSWRYRWWLIDGYLALLYLIVFASAAYIWRPTGGNRRLAMSDEIAQDEEDAEDYDTYALESRGQPHPLNADGIPESRRKSLGDEDVVFEIGDGDSDDEGRTPLRGTGNGYHSAGVANGNGNGRQRLPQEDSDDEDEREGLMSGGGNHVKERSD